MGHEGAGEHEHGLETRVHEDKAVKVNMRRWSHSRGLGRKRDGKRRVRREGRGEEEKKEEREESKIGERKGR